MTDAAIAEHIIYLVNTHTKYLSDIKQQYLDSVYNYANMIGLLSMSGADTELPKYPKESSVDANVNTVLLNRIQATLENREI